MPLSRERFFSGHSLISNKFPRGGKLDDYSRISQSNEVDIKSFGLFDSSSPDFNTFYPNLSPEDLQPQDEDHVYPLFRGLSAIVLSKFGPIDFTRKGVIESSVPLIVGQTIYNNHEQLIGNDVGVVVESSFENARSYDGIKVPAGMNVKLKIDGKANPKLARSIMGDPPSVHSVSVTVMFEWEQSHKSMNRDEFMSKLGTYDENGKLVSRVVTRIMAYDEISLVPHGADPFAKVIRDGKINNPRDSQRRQDIKMRSFSAEDFEGIEYSYDFKNPQLMPEIVSLYEDATIPINSNNTNNSHKNVFNMNEDQLNFFRTQLKLAEDANEESVIAALQAKWTAMATELDTANSSLSTLRQQYPEGSVIVTEEQQTQLNEFGELQSFRDTVIAATRKEAVKLYKILCGGDDKADTAILKMIEEGGYETVIALNKQYKKQVEEKFVATCADCNSTNITRASSANPETGAVVPAGSGGSGTPPAVKTTDEVMENLQRKTPASGFAHGVERSVEKQDA